MLSASLNQQKKLAFISLFAAAWCFQVTVDGVTSLQVFYCANTGCLHNVTKVFCNDEPLSINPPVGACKDIPLPNTVCQHDGRAFVSTDELGSCEFEGHNYIKTEKCTDNNIVCTFTSATTTPSPTTPDAICYMLLAEIFV